MHPLKNPHIIHLDTTRAAVTVEREGKTLISTGVIHFAKPDTQWAELPKEYRVINEDGEEIPASGKFLITVESIDPFHLITDYNKT